MRIKESLLFSLQGYVTGAFFGGKNWIYPLQFSPEANRIRGGIPVCFPFGGNTRDVDGMYGLGHILERHGPFRHTPAEVRENEELKITFKQSYNFTTEHISKRIIGISQEYRILRDGFEQNIQISFDSNPYIKKFPCNLGLHPYFWCKNGNIGAKVVVDQAIYEVVAATTIKPLRGNGSDTHVCDIDRELQSVTILIPGNGTVTMQISGFSQLLIWTDSENYLCVEPVETHWKHFNSEKGSFIEKGELKKYSCWYVFQPE